MPKYGLLCSWLLYNLFSLHFEVRSKQTVVQEMYSPCPATKMSFRHRTMVSTVCPSVKAQAGDYLQFILCLYRISLPYHLLVCTRHITHYLRPSFLHYNAHSICDFDPSVRDFRQEKSDRLICHTTSSK